MELPCHMFLVSMIHRTISLWESSTEVDDEDGPGDQSRSGLSPHELRRELVEDTEDMVCVVLRCDHGTTVYEWNDYGATAGDQVYIDGIGIWQCPNGGLSSKNDQTKLWIQEIDGTFRSKISS